MTILSALVCSASMAMSGASCAVPGGEVSDAEKASVRPWMLWPRPEPINLPPLFTEASGGATVEAWEKTRRPEILHKGFPPCGVAIDAGCVSYHLREGGHGLTLEDWNIYMDFADRHGWRD